MSGNILTTLARNRVTFSTTQSVYNIVYGGTPPPQPPIKALSGCTLKFLPSGIFKAVDRCNGSGTGSSAHELVPARSALRSDIYAAALASSAAMDVGTGTGKIKKLQEAVINRIAAGEVIFLGEGKGNSA